MIRIIIAWYYWITNYNNKLAQRRLKVCAGCELRKGFVCGVCFCPLQTKARLEDEPCGHPDGDKWKSLENHP